MSDRPDARPVPAAEAADAHDAASPTASPTASPASAVGAAPMERRRNSALRDLVDEMLASIRAAANRDLWTPDERQQYESELALIMNRVRAEAMHREQGDG